LLKYKPQAMCPATRYHTNFMVIKIKTMWAKISIWHPTQGLQMNTCPHWRHLEQSGRSEVTDSWFQFFVLISQGVTPNGVPRDKRRLTSHNKAIGTTTIHAATCIFIMFQIKKTFEEVLSRLIAEELIYILAGSSSWPTSPVNGTNISSGTILKLHLYGMFSSTYNGMNGCIMSRIGTKS